MPYRLVFLLLGLVAQLGCAASAPPVRQQAAAPGLNQPDDLDRAIDQLAEHIISRLVDARKSKLAVNEFLTLKGEANDLGKYLSEELATRLINSNRAQVVERRLLQKVLSEQEMGASNLVDDETAAHVGKLLGADTLCTGTLTDLGGGIKVNARLINAETAEVYGAASVDLPKNRAVLALLGGSGMRPAISTGPLPQQQQRPAQARQTSQPQAQQRPAFLVGAAARGVNSPASQTPASQTPAPQIPPERSSPEELGALIIASHPPSDGPDVVMFHNKSRYCVKVWLNGRALKVFDKAQDVGCVPSRERSFLHLSGFGEYRVQASGSAAVAPFKATVAYDRKHAFAQQQRRAGVVFENGDFYPIP